MKDPVQQGRRCLPGSYLRHFLTIFALLGFFNVPGLRAQTLSDKKITIQAENEDLQVFLKRLQKQADVNFVFSSKLIRSDQKVSMSVRGMLLADVLKSVLIPRGLMYEVRGKNIVIRPGVRAEATGDLPESLLVSRDAPSSVMIKGVVRDAATSEPLPGVNILVKGTQSGTSTDTDGKYTLEAPANSVSLTFSFVGYVSLETKIGNRKTIHADLQVDNKSLDEILVMGYGTVKKSDVTGSVSSVRSKELNAYPALGAIQALQGRAAGVQIQANNGEPGSTFKIRVRGSSSVNANSEPLYVIDGLVGGSMPPPEDIETIEILKDASATAIYGSRGSNGVVMVTTKKGVAGKTRIDFNSAFSSQTEIRRLDLLNAAQFLDYIREARPNVVSAGAETDWQDQIFRKGGIQSYQLALAGGNDAVKYYISGAMFDQKGIIINSDYQRVSVTSNLEIQAARRLKIGLNIFGQRVTRNQSKTQEESAALTPGVVAAAYKFEPDQPVRDTTGKFTVARLSDPIDNPYAIATQLQNQSLGDIVQGNVMAAYTLTPDLTFKTTLGATTNNTRAGNFIPSTLNDGRNVGGRASVAGLKNTLLLNENYLQYEKKFNDRHELTVMAGYSYQTSSIENWTAVGQSFTTDAVSFWNLGGSASWQSPLSSLTQWQLASFYGRLTYAFSDRYLLTANIRRDGSSNFSKNNKWATFPSAAFAWKMSAEPFMENVAAISLWKWRASYGATGNQAISPYSTLARFSNVYTIINGVAVNAIRPTSIANDDLTWETTRQLNLGIDVSFFGNRLNLVSDYYRRRTYDLLFNVQLPQYSGYTDQLQNIGSVENKGFELTLNSRNVDGKLKWSTDLNFSLNRNKVLKLPDGNDIFYNSAPGHMVGLGQTQILREGAPVGSFYGYLYDGVYQENDQFVPGGGFETVAGGEKFRDIDGVKDAAGKLTGQPDGMLNSDDRRIIGNPHPKFIWGVSNDFSFKGFDLNLFFQASQGNDLLSYTMMELNLLSANNNATTEALDRWTPAHTNTNVPKATAGRARRASTRWIYDGSYVRLKNLSLGYNIPRNALEKMHLSRLRIYASAQNVLTFTRYKGYDPEVNYSSEGNTDGNRNLGLDYASYPNAKGFTVGLNIGF